MKQATRRFIGLFAIVILVTFAGIITTNITNASEAPADNESELVTSYSAYAGTTQYVSSILSKELSESTNNVDTVGVPLEDAVMNEEGEVVEANFEPYTMYVNPAWLNVRSTPDSSVDDNIIGKLNINDEITVIGEAGDEWAIIEYNDQIAYISQEYIQESLPELETYNNEWTGAKLNRSKGTCQGPSGKETYYNLNMSRCIYYMNIKGYYGYYWVRSDGAKMFTTNSGSYVMCAADLHKYPKGSIVETSLGQGIVVDTGSFTTNGSGVALDIATTW